MNDNGPTPAKTRVATIVLFAIYALVLTGLILFKFPFSYDDSGGLRTVNLIPFAGSVGDDGVFRAGEVIENILVFVPFGIYMSLLKADWSFGKKLIPIVVTTVAFETVQYIFDIGRADITDVLGNTLGGIVGIGIYAVFAKTLGRRANGVIAVVMFILTVVVLLFWSFLFLRSQHV